MIEASIGWPKVAYTAYRKKPKRQDLLVGYMQSPIGKTPIKMKAYNTETDRLDQSELTKRLKQLRKLKLGYKPVHVTKDYHVVDESSKSGDFKILGNSPTAVTRSTKLPVGFF
jgi:hypothetical protein